MAGAIELVDLYRTYPNGTRAVRGLSMVIEPGDYVAFVGPSGSGKSTLVSLISLLMKPDSGDVVINGVSSMGLSQRQRTRTRAATFSFVFQSFHLVEHLTARENIELGLAFGRSGDAMRALSNVGLEAKANSLPARMSGGERQRVAIARALARKTPVVICDEPTGNLDSVTTRSIMELLDDLHKGGTTVIVVTHDNYVMSRAKSVVRLRDGRICDES